MLIKGLQKTTLLDFPGKIACTIFVAGCNFRCPFCQNKDLILPELAKKLKTYKEKEIFEFLEKRKGKLEGVCLTGGEPIIYKDLLKFIKKIKNLGFLVKLDTNGTKPGMVEKLIKNKLLNYVAVDYKGPLSKYYKYTLKSQKSKVESQSDNSKVKNGVIKTIKILLKSGVDFELRTTVVPTLHTKEDLIEMAKELKKLQIIKLSNCEFKGWFLQNFRPKNCLEPKFDKIKPYNKGWFEEILKKLRKIVPNVELRGIY